MTIGSDQRDLQELFGSYKAEWLRERLFTLFDEPAYFPALKDERPCVLVGGRGTGKTTALRCMSYEGQFALASRSVEGVTQNRYVGLYYRVNTNRVTAFDGPEKSQREWQRIFAHYVNLLICQLLADYLQWHLVHVGGASPSADQFEGVAITLGLKGAGNAAELHTGIRSALRELELYINNFDGPGPTLSMLQAPIDEFVAMMKSLPALADKTFYVLLDEYENFLNYQQQVVNTLIKHASVGYVFKIGVKELGWRVRSTINENEHLIAPSDYELIDIEEKLEGNFSAFARKVCETRIEQWAKERGQPHLALDALLPELGYEEEAAALGVAELVGDFKSDIARQEEDHAKIIAAGDLALHVFWTLSRQDYVRAVDSLRKFIAGRQMQVDQYGNYKYSLLFTIAKNGAEVSKYYCGNRVFATISRNNLRYYLHLIAACLERHAAAGRTLADPVTFREQSLAARSVGLQYLTELEGVTVRGVQLAKMVLGFGRLFQILAKNPIGSAPECMEFHIKEAGTQHDGAHTAEVRRLLTDAVMHLALVRSSGTKLATESDIREWDYAVHPIFAPYFGFSHRKKRKLDVAEADIVQMVRSPQSVIRRLLRDRAHLADEQPPAQLQLFDEHFNGPA